MPSTACPTSPAAASPARSEDPASHVGLVYSIAMRVYRAMRWNVELDELVSLGYEGLVQATKRFDATRGVAFSSYAYMRIRGAMYDGMAKLAPIPRGTLRGSRARQRKQRAGFVLSRSERRASLVLFVAPRDPHEDDSLNVLVDPTPPPSQLAAGAEIAAILDAAVDELSDRKRELVRRHYYDGAKLCDAGKELGISKSWASRVHAQALSELRGAVEQHDLAA